MHTLTRPVLGEERVNPCLSTPVPNDYATVASLRLVRETLLRLASRGFLSSHPDPRSRSEQGVVTRFDATFTQLRECSRSGRTCIGFDVLACIMIILLRLSSVASSVVSLASEGHCPQARSAPWDLTAYRGNPQWRTTFCSRVTTLWCDVDFVVKRRLVMNERHFFGTAMGDILYHRSTVCQG